jgi:hypothetical protein
MGGVEDIDPLDEYKILRLLDELYSKYQPKAVFYFIMDLSLIKFTSTIYDGFREKNP